MPSPSISGDSTGSCPIQTTERWRYVVLVAKFSLDFVTQGLLKAFGLLVPYLIAKFGTSYGTIGFILSMELAVFFMACPLVRLVSQRIKPRTLCIVGGVGASAAIIVSGYLTQTLWFGVAMILTGLFSSPMNQISHEVLHQYFGEQFSYANSVCLMGSLVGGMAFPVLTYKLLEGYGLEGALLCLGAIYLNCVPIAATFRAPRTCAGGYDPVSGNAEGESSVAVGELATGSSANEIESREHHNLKSIPHKVLNFFWATLNMRVLGKERAFSLLFLPCKYIIQVTMVSWTLFVVSFAVSKGLDESLAAYLPLAGAFGGFINQGVVTIILHYRPHWGAAVFTIEMTSVAVAFFLYPLSTAFVHLLICSFFVGGGMFGGFPATYSVLVSCVSEENFASMLSVKFFVTGIAVASSGYMAGSLYDLTGSFDVVFLIMGAISVVAVLLTITLMLVKKLQRSPVL